MLHFDQPFCRTNEIVTAKTVRIVNKLSENGFTATLFGFASVNKVPPFMILKKPAVRILRIHSKLKIPANVNSTCSTNEWITCIQIEEWLNSIWRENIYNVDN